MFEVLDSGTADRRETELVALEVMINRFRHRQAVLIAAADTDQTVIADGCRTLAEWVTGRLDVGPETARRLVELARSGRSGETDVSGSFDRTVATVGLAETGTSPDTVTASQSWDVATVRRVTGRYRHLNASTEHEIWTDRFLTIQPSLDQHHWRLRGRLAGVDGAEVSKILDHTADSFPTHPDGTRDRSATRRADALVACVTGTRTTVPADVAHPAPQVTVFVDARHAAATNGETGAWIAGGPRVGPATLEQLLCEATVEVTALTSEGVPLAVGSSTTVIPARLRRHVLFRDHGSCVADGCGSTHRVQPHHITHRRHGGNNHPDNLASLCWFHHHVIIHRRGFSIDPTSPPGRRRFLPP